MSAAETSLRLRRDGSRLIDEWREHLDPTDGATLRETLRSSLLRHRVDLHDDAQVARYHLEVRGHLGWFEHRGIR